MRILGISCYYHDAAACLLDDGRIVAAAQEERFTRKKHDHRFPANAVRYCLAEGGVVAPDAIAFYDKPIRKFHRILETYFSVAPSGLRSFVRAVPLWLRQKLWVQAELSSALDSMGALATDAFYFPEHHMSHAASAFYPSPFVEAAVLTIDGVGEWDTATIGVGEGNRLRLTQALRFPHSLGLLYSAFTYFTGFKVNSGEYKLMGLAPYGTGRYTQKIFDELLDLKEDGSFRLNMSYFGFLADLKMTNARFARFFGGPPRRPEAPIGPREMDIAKSIQEVTEEIVLRMARTARRVTGKRNLCLAGGVALNCVANGKLLRAGIFDDLWIQPAAGDAGGALGAALAVWHNPLNQPREVVSGKDSMEGSYLGPSFSRNQIKEYLEAQGYPYEDIPDERWPERVAELLSRGCVVGNFQGRMEFGPRALGNRSILGDARSEKMQSVMNLKIKYRESFRPFAPSCLEHRAADFFQLDRASPYMLLVAPVKRERCLPDTGGDAGDLCAWVNRKRSDIPAITHVDCTARIQTVNKRTNRRYFELIEAFEKLTGYGIVVNTSFNVRGEPIVCTPADAYRCFMRTEMDYLALGPFLLDKKRQERHEERENWRETFALD